MNMKISSITLAILIIFSSFARADEGMWIPILLKKYNIKDMQKKGFKLTAEDIYSVNKASMKDAVMIFGGGCTAELISDKGLLITNHHCGYSQIQSHSSVEHDYLTDGFWAMNADEELINPGLTVTFLVRMEDVTEAMLKGIRDDMPEKDREAQIKKNSAELVEKAIKDTHYTAKVKPFFNGNQYFLFVEETYKDVRLVGAPPSAVGKFGGDTDNWMWPRHTGDFSMFRIYADKNNQPAEYSEDNVPYKPKKHFPVSIKGVKKGDFTMVFGYPGHTQEYLTSYAVDMIKNKINPYRIDIRKAKIDIMAADMNADPAVRIQYASKYARVSNYWKKWIGENRGLARLNAVQRKQETEKQLTEWINADKKRQELYGALLPQFKKLYAELTPYKFAQEYFFEAIWTTESVRMASKLRNLYEKGENYAPEDVESVKKAAEKFFKNYNIETDKKLFRKMLQMYYTNVDKKFQPDYASFIKSKYLNLSDPKVLDAYVDYYFSKTFFLHEDAFNKFINSYGKSSSKKIKKAPAFQLYKSFINLYVAKIMPNTKAKESEIEKLNRMYMRALREADTSKVFYPDANFTLRVAFGQVAEYDPRDGVHYKFYTTLDGIMEKDNPDIYDYRVPQKLKDLHAAKDYGQYAENGELHVCFTASNHTTGGNSGSPVLNGNGELIGVNFDRNWEGTMSDIMYDPDQCRNISLDIRYALFIIDKFAGAGYLLDEMTIVK